MLENLKNPIKKINFYDLTHFGGSFKSECPECGEGLLLVARDLESGELLPQDRCTLCAQAFEYADFKEMKKFGGRHFPGRIGGRHQTKWEEN